MYMQLYTYSVFPRYLYIFIEIYVYNLNSCVCWDSQTGNHSFFSELKRGTGFLVSPFFILSPLFSRQLGITYCVQSSWSCKDPFFLELVENSILLDFLVLGNFLQLVNLTGRFQAVWFSRSRIDLPPLLIPRGDLGHSASRDPSEIAPSRQYRPALQDSGFIRYLFFPRGPWKGEDLSPSIYWIRRPMRPQWRDRR